MSLEATCQLRDARTERWDVVVVGAGVAGTMAAIGLARLGRRVMLVDKAGFPRNKVCGGCMNLRALGVLQQAGLGDLVARLGGVPLETFQLSTDRRCAIVAMPGGMAVSRYRLDESLIRVAIENGVQFTDHCSASLLPPSPDCRVLRLQRKNEAVDVEASIVLAADGLHSSLLRRSGEVAATVASDARIGAGILLEDDRNVFLPGRIYMATGEWGYVGITRVEDGKLDVAAALDTGALRTFGGPGPLVAQMLQANGLPLPAGASGGAWQGTPPLTRQTARPGAERVFALGDAAGYVEPFTGEGMAWALSAGQAVVPHADAGIAAWTPAVLASWTAEYSRCVVQRQWICKGLAAVLRRPVLTDCAVRLLAWQPGLARPILNRISAAAP